MGSDVFVETSYWIVAVYFFVVVSVPELFYQWGLFRSNAHVGLSTARDRGRDRSRKKEKERDRDRGRGRRLCTAENCQSSEQRWDPLVSIT